MDVAENKRWESWTTSKK